MSFESAKRAYESEVEAEAERLIERGVAPFAAMRRAADIVSDRRQRKADQKSARTD